MTSNNFCSNDVFYTTWTSSQTPATACETKQKTAIGEKEATISIIFMITEFSSSMIPNRLGASFLTDNRAMPKKIEKKIIDNIALFARAAKIFLGTMPISMSIKLLPATLPAKASSKGSSTPWPMPKVAANAIAVAIAIAVVTR